MSYSMTAGLVTPPTGGVIEVRQLAPADSARWDAFVAACPEATFFHLSGWKDIIEQAMGHAAYYLLAESHGEIQGVLPLGHVHSRLFGNALMSVPFCVYGGIAAVDEAARTALEAAARGLAERLGVDYLEMRDRQLRHPGWPAKDMYVTFRKTLDPDPEKNLLAIPRKQRAMVRKGIEAGLTGAIDDDVGRLHDIYAESVRHLGTPVFSKKYFATLRQVFGPACEVLTISHAGRPVSSVMSFYFRDEVLPYYGGGTRAARAVAGNDFLYWELMRRAGEKGVRLFDYGRSKVGTGSYSFKKNWGFTPEPLHYEYYLVKAREVPNVSPLNPKYRMFIEIWKRMPLALTKLVGPMIARNLG
jgi:FemAB-related protein (PEP-CTERM system-associated)